MARAAFGGEGGRREVSKMKCPNCGETSRIRKEDKFCHNCGCSLKTGVMEKQTEISLVRSGNLYALKVCSKGLIPIADYKIQSSAEGDMELCVTIKGVPRELELIASLEE